MLADSKCYLKRYELTLENHTWLHKEKQILWVLQRAFKIIVFLGLPKVSSHEEQNSAKNVHGGEGGQRGEGKFKNVVFIWTPSLSLVGLP